MGSVWLAYHQAAHGHCAVKILNTEDEHKGTAERSFNREVRAMARLNHGSIVKVYDYGRTPKGSPFFAMEYVPGKSLHDYIHGSWRYGQIWNLLDVLLAALGHAHARDMVHRDLKPGNIIVLPELVGEGSLKLVDFGIALTLQDAEKAGRRIEGTPAYIAPEAASGDVAAIGPWTDLYSLGVILFEILTGDLPFHGRNLLTHHQRSPVPEMQIRSDVEAPPGLIPIVLRLLEKSPIKRFHSAAGVRRALRRLGDPPAPLPLGYPPESERSWLDERSMTLDLDNLEPITRPLSTGLIHLQDPPLAGRVEECKLLRRAADLVLAGAGPRIVIIEGQAGLGKSRLADGLREELAEAGKMRTLVARSEPQTTDAGIRQGILRFIGAPSATPVDAKKLLSEAFPEPSQSQLAYEALFGGDLADPKTRQINDSLVELLKLLAQDGPMLIQSEDAQWSTEGRIFHLIRKLAKSDEASQLLIVLTLRPLSIEGATGEEVANSESARRGLKQLLALPYTDYIKLGPLNPVELSKAWKSMAPLPEDLVEAACFDGWGNPFWALQSIRNFVESEGLSSAPADPSQLLQTRIERATSGDGGEALRSVLARSTLLGRSFMAKHLLKLCEVAGGTQIESMPSTVEELEVLLERGVNSGLVVEQAEGRWRFSHDLVRSQFRQICHQMPQFAALSLAAANLKMGRARKDNIGIEMEVVARHFWDGGDEVRALRLGLESVTRLHRAGLMGQAATFMRKLMGWDEQKGFWTPTERGEVLLLGSDACEHAGQWVDAELYAQQAVQIAESQHFDALGARAASRLGILAIRRGMISGAEGWLYKGLRFAHSSGDAQARAEAHLSLGQYYQQIDQLELAEGAYEESKASAPRDSLLDLAARRALASINRLNGNLEHAVDALRTLLDLSKRLGLEVATLETWLELGLCAWSADDPNEALHAFDEVYRGARGNLLTLEFHAAVGEAWAYAAQKQWDKVDLILGQAEDLRYDVRLRDSEMECLCLDLAQLAKEQDQLELVPRIESLYKPHSQTTVVGTPAFSKLTDLGGSIDREDP